MKVYVYYEENYGRLAEGVTGAVENLVVFDSAEKAKEHVKETIKTYAGDYKDDQGCNHYCLEKYLLMQADIEKKTGLTDEEIHKLVDTTFTTETYCIELYEYMPENYDSWFRIVCTAEEIK